MGGALDSFGSFTRYFLQNERSNLEYLSYVMLIFGVQSFVLLQYFPSPYGRHGSSAWGFLVNGKFAWFTQELPAFAIPVLLVVFADCPQLGASSNRILLGLFLLHYFQRTFIYPMLIRGGKPTPFIPYTMAISFCCANGYLQGRSLTRFVAYPKTWMTEPRVWIGMLLFFVGMGVNIHSDHILMNLRKPGETGYKIPKGGMFSFVSGANFLGEVIEWSGYACACWNLPALAFACFTFLKPCSTCHATPQMVQAGSLKITPRKEKP
ncbi:LOW QUALITY PROTEIN: 3-oxo-5-alpha-steroid 4-dehydrogenase 1-like [Liolophura sinensis]|uniref:LOW QUALITY PROTEIN: 3-oxo-5-alpha-steroid 4-dehydrogenase 1-like n=1 Tax=Liolophura sinensis TaxID=3198878 RepID=UPI00315989A8